VRGKLLKVDSTIDSTVRRSFGKQFESSA
jgi:hypothetical protein